MRRIPFAALLAAVGTYACADEIKRLPQMSYDMWGNPVMCLWAQPTDSHL